MWDDDEEYLAARASTVRKMLGMCEWIPAEELVVRVDQPHARELVASWEGDRQIFSIPSPFGALYPHFQFDSKMRPLPIIKDVLSILSKDDTLAISAWFIFKNGWISELVDGAPASVAPMHILEDRDAVLRAARNSTGTHYA
jgi:hypothetical protein